MSGLAPVPCVLFFFVRVHVYLLVTSGGSGAQCKDQLSTVLHADMYTHTHTHTRVRTHTHTHTGGSSWG